jgi:uncharacterized RDD family membrane protein YckC
MYAGFWNRFAAIFFDGLVLIVPYFLLSFLAGLIGGVVGAILGALLIIALLWLYNALLNSSASQGTIGKMIIGLKVTDVEGNRISFLRATARFFATWIAPIVAGIINFIGVFLGPLALVFVLLAMIVSLGAYVMAVFTPKRQALHDLVAGTMVVDKSTEPGTEPSGFKPAVGWAITTSVALSLTPVFAASFGLLFLGLGAVSGMSSASTAMGESASSDFAAQATISTAASLAEGTKFAVEQYAQTHDGIYPSNTEELAAAGMGIASEFPGVTISIGREGEIVAAIDSPAGELRYTPSSEGGLTNWTCTATGVDSAYLPDDCTPQ